MDSLNSSENIVQAEKWKDKEKHEIILVFHDWLVEIDVNRISYVKCFLLSILEQSWHVIN